MLNNFYMNCEDEFCETIEVNGMLYDFTFEKDEERRKDNKNHPVFIADPYDQGFFLVIDAKYVESEESLFAIAEDSLRFISSLSSESSAEVLKRLGVRYVEKDNDFDDEEVF